MKIFCMIFTHWPETQYQILDRSVSVCRICKDTLVKGKKAW